VQSGSNKKIANNLVAASCAAVLAVYIAGYARTQSAADRFAAQIAERRPVLPDAFRPIPQIEEIHPSAPDVPKPAPSHPAHEAVKSPVASPESLPTPTTSATPEPATIEPAPSIPVTLPSINPPAEPTPLKSEAAPAPTWKDGTYTGWGYSRHGNIEASVVIEAGRIAAATISQCRTRYSCSVIERLPPQVAERQSPEVDYVSGATQSADAFYGAVVSALNKAK
jgi:uncharacterized protein with FMN-binding domain